MADNVTKLPPLGKTYGSSSATGVSVGLEGTMKVFADVDYSGTSQVKAKRSGNDVRAILVRNTSGITLNAKAGVTYATGYQGRRVDGYHRLDGGGCSGIVDPFLTGGCANNDLFWMIVEGPCVCSKDTSATAVIKDDWVVAETAAASTFSTTAGRIKSIITTSNQTFAASYALNAIGIAMSTSATTNADILVRLRRRP
jgi:hypothetical protein